MTRLELAKKRAKELEKKQSNVTNKENTQSISNTSKTNKRLELAKQRASEVENEYKKAEEQQQAWNDYVSKNGVDKINSDYGKYMKSVNNTLTPKLSQTDSMQNILANKNVITPQEIKKAKEEENKSALDKFYDNVVEPSNQFHSSLFYNTGKPLAKAIYKTGKTLDNAIKGEEHPFQKAQEQTDTVFSNFEKVVGYDTTNKSEKVQKANMAGNVVGNVAGYIGGGMALGGGALGYGAVSGATAFGNTNDVGDVAFETGTGAMFGAISSATNNAVIKGIEKAFPVTNPLTGNAIKTGALALKNAIAGGTGTYTATATTGELRNAYNKLRGREVTKEDWIKPVWSTETAVSTLLGAGLGAYSGTKADLTVRAKYEKDVNTLVNELKIYAEEFNTSIQNGDQEVALDIVRASRDKLVQFSMNKYGNRTVDPKVMNEVANKWKTYLENTTEYYNFVYNDMNANVNGQGKLGNSTLENLKNKYNTNTVVPSGQVLREKYSMPTKLSIDTATQNDYTKINLGETKNVSTSKLMELYASGGERTTEQINSLREDIKNNGITEPIEISQKSDGTYTIENGNHRLQIANELGINEVPVKMVESWDNFVSRLQNKEARTEYGVNTIAERANTSNEESRSSGGLLRDSNKSSESGRGTTTNVGISTSKSDSDQQTSSNENKGTNRKTNTIKNSNKSSFSLPKNSVKNISDNTQTLTNTAKSFQNIIKNNSTIQGLEDYSEQDVKNIVSDHVEDLYSEAKIKNIKINEKQDTNQALNVTIEYDGNISQEELNSILNQDPLVVDGVKININAEDLNLFEENKRYDSKKYNFENVKKEAKEDYDSTYYWGGYDLNNKYERRQRNIDLRNIKNDKILAEQGISEDVNDILEKITKMRHEIHSSDDLFNSESVKNNEQTEFLDTINGDLYELGLPEIRLPFIQDLVSDLDVYELGEDYDETYEKFVKQKEEINNSIEEWLQAFDLEFGTHYAPTGIARASYFGIDIARGNDYNDVNENVKLYDDGRATIQGELVKDDFVEKEFNGQETVLSDFTKREIVERVVDDIENYVQNKGKITHAELDKYIEHLNNNASRNAELERYYREDSVTENFNAWKEAKKIYKNTMKSALKELGYEYDNEKNAFVKHYELPKTEDEVWTNVEARISSEIEKDMKWFVDNNFQNYERVDGEYVEDYVDRLITEIYTPAELEYIYDKDFGNEVFFAVKETLHDFIVEKGYTSEQDTGEIVPHYEPDISFLENSDEIRMEYGRLPSTDFEFAQLDKIRDEIQALVWDIKDTLPNNIDITYDESSASADATYITLYNEDTDETYEIRIGNHFKWGTSGEADEHIRISDFSTITKLKKAVKVAIEDGLIDLGVENVDIIKESDYNGYKVTRKDEPNNYAYKRITDKDRARVNSDYMLNKAKYEDDVGVVNFDDVSYAYEIGNGNIEIISKFKGSQKFINSVEEAWKNGIDNLSNGNTKIIESIRSTKRESNTSNGDGRRQEKSRTSDRQNIGYGRQQRNVNSTEINKNNGNNLENSEQSSFSLPKNQDTVKENSQDYEYTNEKEKLHIERAEEIFGYTDDFEKAGYLTWDGKLLDFSDGSDRRIEDHRAINQVFDETFDTNSDYLIKFMNEGNIRINPETPGIEISNFTEPSNAQLDMIEEYADWNKYGGYFVVDFCNKYGDNIGSLEYENNINPSRIIDDINEFFRTGELPNVEETNKQYDNQITIEDNLRTKMYYKSNGNKPVVVAQRYWNGFEKKGYIDLSGKIVRDAQDVAELSQIFRNPQYETARIIYVKGDTIVGQEAVSSHLPNSSAIFTDKNRSKAFYKIEDRMKRLNADGYYMVHNHPSGVAKASQQDINVTKTVSNNVKGFKGHIIVDHGTYAYISKGLDGDITYRNELKVDDKNALYKGSTFETVLLTDKVPWSEKIDSREDFASLMYNLKNSPNYSSLILSDSNNKINAIIDVPNGFFNMRTNHVEGYIRNVAKQYGATKAFIGTSNSEVFDRLKQLSNLQDVILYKDNQKQFADKGNKIFETNNRSTAVRTAEETKDERIERVRKYIEEFQQGMGSLGVKVNRKEIIEKIIDNYGITTKGNSKELDKVSTEIQKLLEDGALTDKKIEGYAEYLIDNLKVTIDDFYSANKELKELIRQTKLYASDTVKNGFESWNDFRKNNMGTLRLTNDENALPIDTFYKELTEIYGEMFFPSDIANISDQLERISEVAKQIKIIDQTLRENIKDNFGEEAIQEIQDGLVQNLKTWRDKMAQESSENTEEESEPDKIEQRSWTETAKNNEMLDKFLDIKNMNYVVSRNVKAVEKANNILELDGYEKALNYFESVIESHKIPTSSDMVLGERLIQEAIKRGEFEKATELVSEVTILGTELGQPVQAMSVISRLSPAGQLMHLKRVVKRLSKEIERKTPKKKRQKNSNTQNTQGTISDDKNKMPKEIRDNSKLKEMVTEVVEGEQGKLELGATDEALEATKEFKGLEITPEMEMEILSAKTPEELKMAMARVKEQLASQMPVDWTEKLSSWRYLSMLGNPKTHIRNIAGNVVMGKVLYKEKNLIQRIIETTFDSKLEERTRTFKKPTQTVQNFANAVFEENQEQLSGSGYSNLQSEIKSMRKIFKTRLIQWLNEKNSSALEKEDFWAKKSVFKSSLAEYLTANGIKTEQDIKQNSEIVQKGINYAVDEALKATFNQYNALASAISQLENRSAIGRVLVGGLAPFKKTPLNIVKTAWQYSPMGLIETLTIQTHNLRNGLINANEYIERISQGLSGASVTALGFLLASLGLLTGSTGNDKKKKNQELIGLFAPYSIHIPNTDIYIDISWLAPTAVPLLVGSELYYALKDEGENGNLQTFGAIMEVLERSMNPTSELTMLKTLNDALINYGGGDNSIDGIMAFLTTAIVSYIGQAFPTLGYQINKIIDKTIRSTSAGKNSLYPTGERTARQAISKTPGASYLLEPSTDIWGNVRERSDSVVLRSFDSLINPATVTRSTATKVDEEILKLYDKNGNDKILPSTPQKYFTANSVKYEMSASEYTQYKMTYGQTAYKKLKTLFSTSEYRQMSNTEKEKAIEEVYDYAKQMAKYDYLTSLYGKTKGMEKLLSVSELKKYNESKKLGLNYEKYLEAYYSQKSVEGNKDKNGNTIKNSEKENQIEAIQKALNTTKEKAEKLQAIFAGKYKEES